MLFTEVLITLIVIMDPIGNVPAFLSLTARDTEHQQRRAALVATVTAGTVIIAFAAFGNEVLDLLDISLAALQVSGGLILAVVALQLLNFPSAPPPPESGMNPALVPLGTPLLAGPGAIAAIMVNIREADDGAEVSVVIGAVIAALAVTYVVLLLAVPIRRLLRENGIALLSRIVGMLLAAIAVQLVASGIDEWVRNGV